MHKKWIWGIVLIVSVSSIFGYNVYRLNKSMPVDLITVKMGTVAEKVYANGALESKFVVPQIVQDGGVVKELLVQANEAVTKGQPLLVFASDDLRQQLQMEQNNLTMIEAEWAARKKLDFEQTKSDLLAGNPITKDQNDYISYELRIANERLTIKSLQDKLSHIQLMANQDGVITTLNLKQGQAVPQGFTAMEITDVNTLQVRANLNELDANKVKLNMQAIISGDAFAQTYQGTVSYLAPIAAPIDPSSKDPAVELLVSVAESSDELRPGYNASLEIAISHKPQWVVPLTAVQHNGDETYVYKIVQAKAVKVEVKTGLEDDEQIEILEGLQAQDQVIKAVSDDLKDGLKVKVR